MSESIIEKHKVDFHKKIHTLLYHGETYHWDRDNEWHRISKHNPKKRHLLDRWTSERHLKLIGRLDRILRIAKEEQIKQAQKDVLALQDLGLRADGFVDSVSESADEEHKKPTQWQKHMKGGPPAKGKRVERDKYGVRVYSSDGKTWWNVCVNKSTKYEGTAVRMMLPPRKDGKPPWAVFDLEAMEALRREFDRGEQPKKR